jgi:serine/threonine protein kinase
LKETFDEKDTCYIVFEYLPGGELFDRVADKGRYSEAETRVVFHALLEAMNYLHGMGIVHRNLKPETILLISGTVRRLGNTVAYYSRSQYIVNDHAY